MTTIPSGASTLKPTSQPVPREQLPAYSRNSDIKHTFKMPGLDFAYICGLVSIILVRVSYATGSLYP